MRLNSITLLLACCLGLRAQGDFAICRDAGPEILRQGSARSPQTDFCIGYLYAFGRGVLKDMGAAATHFRAAAEKGYTPAQAVLGVHYAKGLGVAQNWTEAVRWYRQAVIGGHAGAAVNLGQCYQNGNGVRQDRAEAAKLYRFAADRGDPSAAGLLASIGGSPQPAAAPTNNVPQRTPAARTFPIPPTPPTMGVPLAQRDEAEQLWQRAVALVVSNAARDAMPVLYRCALMGDRRAEATLGIRYQDGDGVKADDHAAAYWFGLAAAQGHRGSQYALGGMYLEGEGGLPKDLAKATALLIKSANQGFDKAQLALGISYEFGEGVPRDRAKAIALIRQSGLAGEIASVLASPRTPKSFANEDAFGAYLSSLRNAQIAASWAQSRASRGPWSGTDGYFDHNSTYWQQRRHQESLGK